MSTPPDPPMPTSTSSSMQMQHLKTQLRTYRQALSAFGSSRSKFRVLTSLPATAKIENVARPPEALYILDSSFNPPTLAHLRIALSALRNGKHASIQSPKRLILLLSTQNADKAPKPASFEQRLVMMEIMAQDLLSSLKSDSEKKAASEDEELVSIDIALTTHALFTQKALSVSSSPSYPSEIPQTHLVGYDTLIRILTPRYYDPPTLSSLKPFLASHLLLVTYRPGASWDGKREQDAYLDALRNGERDEEGGKREWVTEGRIEMDQSITGEGDEEVVSSTKVREAVKMGDQETLGKLVTNGVMEWILAEGLYRDH